MHALIQKGGMGLMYSKDPPQKAEAVFGKCCSGKASKKIDLLKEGGGQFGKKRKGNPR